MAMPTHEKVEVWIWYSLVICIVGIRFASQYITRRRKFVAEFPIDDALMILLTCIYTTGTVALYLYFSIAPTVDFDNPTPEENFVIGRKLGILNILTETCVQTTLWGNKCCLLLLYNRLTFFHQHYRLLMVIAVYTGLAYVAVIVALYAGWCRPFSDYLVLVPTNIQCLSWMHYNTLQLTMNLSTDLLIILVPVALFSRLKIEFRRKILLIGLFSMGVFVIISAILLKVAVFTNPTDPVWFLWVMREMSTAMLVGNLVLCMPVFRTWFKCLVPRGRTKKGTDASGASLQKKSVGASDSGTDTTFTPELGLSWPAGHEPMRV